MSLALTGSAIERKTKSPGVSRTNTACGRWPQTHGFLGRHAQRAFISGNGAPLRTAPTPPATMGMPCWHGPSAGAKSEKSDPAAWKESKRVASASGGPWRSAGATNCAPQPFPSHRARPFGGHTERVRDIVQTICPRLTNTGAVRKFRQARRIRVSETYTRSALHRE